MWQYQSVKILSGGSDDDCMGHGSGENVVSSAELVALGNDGWEVFQVDPECNGFREYHLRRQIFFSGADDCPFDRDLHPERGDDSALDYDEETVWTPIPENLDEMFGDS